MVKFDVIVIGVAAMPDRGAAASARMGAVTLGCHHTPPHRRDVCNPAIGGLARDIWSARSTLSMAHGPGGDRAGIQFESSIAARVRPFVAARSG